MREVTAQIVIHLSHRDRNIHMNQRQELLNKIIAWLENNTEVATAILVGSDARNDHPSDEYSDYDIEIYTDKFEQYAQDESWLSRFGNIWVNVREKTDEGYPTRLVIYEGGLKVDFSLRPTSYLTKLIERGTLPNYYQEGCQFLVDKNSYQNKFKQCKFDTQSDDLNPKEFLRIVEEFWFEVWHIGKYLKRNDLWVAKFRDAGVKEFLLKMIEWHAKSVKGLDSNTWYQGRFMQEWTDVQTWEELDSCFGHFNAGDSWQALFSTMKLFRKLARETASNLEYEYPDEVDKNITDWVNNQYSRS